MTVSPASPAAALGLISGLTRLTRLSPGRLRQHRVRREPGRSRRLDIPPALPTPHGHDAVGLPERCGQRIMDSLPRVGCVFADPERWWWIVPAQSGVGLHWPAMARYAVGAVVSASRPKTPRAGAAVLKAPTGPRPDWPQLIHHPCDDVPYTHPLLLYITVCTIAGTPPVWPHGDRPHPA